MRAKDARETRFGILAYPGAQEAAVLGLRDLLCAAADASPTPPVSVQVVRPDDLPARSFTAVVLPPSLGGAPPGPPDPALGTWIRARHDAGTTVCSVCVGAFVLAELGLLDRRPATTHWALASTFRERFPRVRLEVDRMVVDDGDIVTAGGVMAWVDLGLALVARFLGPTVALAVSRLFLVDPGGRVQSLYASFSPVLNHGDAPILAVQHWLQGRIDKPVSVEAMAARADLPRRTFLRRFQRATGLRTRAYLQALRIHRARELLESSNLGMDELAWQVGYEDAGSLRRVFVDHLGTTPLDYRRRFGIVHR